jgi:hypothetical protein
MSMWHVVNYLTMGANTDIKPSRALTVKKPAIDVEIAGARTSLGWSLSIREQASHGAIALRPSHRGYGAHPSTTS